MKTSPFRISQTVEQLISILHAETGIEKPKIYSVLHGLGNVIETTIDVKHKSPKIFSGIKHK